MAALGPAPGDRVGDGQQELVLGAAVFVAELALASNGVDRGVEGASVVLDQAVVLFQYEQVVALGGGVGNDRPTASTINAWESCDGSWCASICGQVTCRRRPSNIGEQLRDPLFPHLLAGRRATVLQAQRGQRRRVPAHCLAIEVEAVRDLRLRSARLRVRATPPDPPRPNSSFPSPLPSGPPDGRQ